MNRRSNHAFSMPEILMTLVVFSFGLLPLIVLFQSSHRQTAQAKNLMVAHSIGRSMISEIRAYGFDILNNEIDRGTLNIVHTNRTVTGPVVRSDPDSIIYPEYYNRFYTTVTLDRAVNDPSNRKITVKLDIEWKEHSARDFKLGFGTVVVKYGT